MPANGRRYPRTARLNELIREIVAESLEQWADEDERLELITVTGVETERDIRQATVYFTARHDGAAEALGELRTRLQREINRQTTFKRTPQLSFVEDPGVTSGWKIEGILRDIHDREAHRGHGGDAGGDDDDRT